MTPLKKGHLPAAHTAHSPPLRTLLLGFPTQRFWPFYNTKDQGSSSSRTSPGCHLTNVADNGVSWQWLPAAHGQDHNEKRQRPVQHRADCVLPSCNGGQELLYEILSLRPLVKKSPKTFVARTKSLDNEDFLVYYGIRWVVSVD